MNAARSCGHPLKVAGVTVTSVATRLPEAISVVAESRLNQRQRLKSAVWMLREAGDAFTMIPGGGEGGGREVSSRPKVVAASGAEASTPQAYMRYGVDQSKSAPLPRRGAFMFCALPAGYRS